MSRIYKTADATRRIVNLLAGRTKPDELTRRHLADDLRHLSEVAERALPQIYAGPTLSEKEAETAADRLVEALELRAVEHPDESTKLTYLGYDEETGNRPEAAEALAPGAGLTDDAPEGPFSVTAHNAEEVVSYLRDLIDTDADNAEAELDRLVAEEAAQEKPRKGLTSDLASLQAEVAEAREAADAAVDRAVASAKADAR